MKKDHRENTVGPWAETKLDALEGYLKFYGTALKNQHFKRVYIDAFAGSCVSKLRSNQDLDEAAPFFDDPDYSEAQNQFILGSPMRALGISNKFHQHYFFDLDKTRAEILQSIMEGNDNVSIEVGDCNPKIKALAPSLKSKNIRGVAFLDPYGAHLEWATLVALAEAGTMEVVINLPLDMSINRLITKSGDVPEKWSKQLTLCFGTDEWRNIAYTYETNLFGEEVITKKGGVSTQLLKLYKDRLESIFRFVSIPRLICNTRNAPLYYLIWAGPNKLGLKVAEHVLSQGHKVYFKK